MSARPLQQIADRLLAYLDDQAVVAPDSALAAAGGRWVEIVYGRGEPPVRDLTKGRTRCQAAVMELFEELVPPGERRTADQVAADLEEAGYRFSPALVRKSLTQLSAAGDLRNARNKRGYWLPAAERSLFE